MKSSLFKWQFAGFLFTCVAGTLLHFLYEWTGNNIIAAVFSGVNESTWEHMKILFIPMFVFAIVEKHLICVDSHNFWCAKLKGFSLGLITIPVLFYTYNGAIGQSPAWLNIAIFYISAAMAFIYETYLIKNKKPCFFSQTMAFSIICIIALMFLVFTFVQPPLLIFRDPLTNSYGM